MASFVENVNKVAALIPAESVDLGVVADNIDNINLLKPVITDLQSIVNNVVPNIAEILLADDNAATATTKAGKASTSASEALGYRNEALGFRNEAEAFSESKAFVVDTVEDLLTIPSSYVTAVVRDLNRGGTFIWSATGTANGGTVFAGATGYWNRQYSGAINVKWFGANGDGVTSSQDRIAAAVAAAYAIRAELEWPVGTYVSTENIPNFLDVQHVCSGVIKRGVDMFKISPIGSQQNVLYVSPTGSDANDGLSPAQPVTLQTAIDALRNYGPMLDGNWSINLAAGVYAGGMVIDGLTSKNMVVVKGPDVGGHPNVPTAVLDGAGQTADAGIYASGAGLQLHVKNIKSINWRSNSVSSGFVFDNGAEAYLENCHTYNCLWAGANFDSVPHMRVKGGVYENSTFYGIRCRAQVSFSIGYQGNATDNRPIIRGCGAGIQLRDSCSGHVDYSDISNCNTGITLSNQARVNAVSNTISSCNLGIYAESSSSVADQTTIFSGNTFDRRLTGGSTRYQEEDNLFFQDSGIKRFSFGKAVYTGSVNSTTAYMFGTDRDTIASMSFMVPESTTAQLIFGRPSATGAGIISYRHTDVTPSWRFQCEGTASASFFSTDFRPGADNARSLGTSGVRWSTVYAGTGAINTSDDREKTYLNITDIEKQVAVELKANMKKFKFNNAIEIKGEKARIHFGASAQTVKSIFEKYGLNGFDYAILCYDEWEEQEEVKDEEGNIIEQYRPAGDRYGIRYEELLCFIISAM